MHASRLGACAWARPHTDARSDEDGSAASTSTWQPAGAGRRRAEAAPPPPAAAATAPRCAPAARRGDPRRAASAAGAGPLEAARRGVAALAVGALASVAFVGAMEVRSRALTSSSNETGRLWRGSLAWRLSALRGSSQQQVMAATLVCVGCLMQSLWTLAEGLEGRLTAQGLLPGGQSLARRSLVAMSDLCHAAVSRPSRSSALWTPTRAGCAARWAHGRAATGCGAAPAARGRRARGRRRAAAAVHLPQPQPQGAALRRAGRRRAAKRLAVPAAAAASHRQCARLGTRLALLPSWS